MTHPSFTVQCHYSIITTNLDGIIQVFNQGAEQMLGYSMGEIVGQATPAIFCDDREIAERAVTLSTELERDIPAGFAVLTTKASRHWTVKEG